MLKAKKKLQKKKMFIYNTSFGIGDVSGRFADSTEPQFSKCSSMSTIPASNKNEL